MEYIKKLNKGSFSSCYLYKKNNKDIVIKNSIYNDVYNQFMELYISKLYSYHPNIIPINDIVIDNNNLYYEYDYYKLTLTDFINITSIEKRKHYINKFIKQLLSCVHYLHNNDIIHGDIKDNNILIDDDFNIKLIDYGSCVINNITSKPEVITTYPYRAPEVFLKLNYGYKIDIWSIGVILLKFIDNIDIIDIKSSKNDNYNRLREIYHFIENINIIKSDYIDLYKYIFKINCSNRPNISELINFCIDKYNIKIDIIKEKINISEIKNEDLIKFNDNIMLNNNILYIGNLLLDNNSNNLDIITSWYINYVLINLNYIDTNKFFTICRKKYKIELNEDLLNSNILKLIIKFFNNKL